MNSGTVTVMADAIGLDINNAPQVLHLGGVRWHLTNPEPIRAMLVYTSDEPDFSRLRVILDE